MKKNSVIIVICLAVIIGLAVFFLYQGKESAGLDSSSTVQEEVVDVPTAAKIEDFTLPDTNGKACSAMSEISQNKLTIIDFWASWCGPCMREMPNLHALYTQFKGKGLGILGVSLDTDKDAWLTTIQEKDMSWTNVSDLKGWNSVAARQFDITAIPYALVVDAQGTILAGGLRGESLQLFIEEHLKE